MAILEDRVSAVHSLENVRHLAIKRLRSLPPRNAVLKGGSNPSFDIRTVDVKPLAVHPESRRSFVERVMRKSAYAISTKDAQQAIARRHEEFFEVIDRWKQPVTTKEVPEDWLGS
jgi:hypothetical protein